MTNKEGNVDLDIEEETCDARLAALLAVQLVRQVLDEAYAIANAASESDQPWRCMSVVKNISSSNIEIEDDENSYAAYKGDCEDNVSEHEEEDLTNAVVTSTPQKITREIFKVIDANIIGQGDEGIDLHENELNNSTATFINHLFDMSDVERVIICDDNEFIPSIEPSNLPLQDITKIMASYVNDALSMAFVSQTRDADIRGTKDYSKSTDYSAYSFLSDAIYAEDLGTDVAFLINHGIADMLASTQAVTVENVEDIEDEADVEEESEKNEDIDEEETEKNNATLCEHAYLTLNRDYEQCSEEEEPVLLDPKGLAMQEVELMTAQTSDDDSSITSEKKQCQEMAATSAVSAASRKSLVHRCRSQGARLLACLRGWWRRKTPGKRKESRITGSIRGICPLSPEARLRASSMLDQRRRSPSPNRSVVWKFNTVNEALVNSSRWKEYTFEVKTDECGEY